MTKIFTEIVDKQLDGLEALANTLAREYWDWRDTENDKLDVRERAQLNLRIRRRDSTIEITWLKLTFVMNKTNGEKITWYPRSKTLPKGKQNRYPASTLERNGRKWEIERSQELEDKFAEIRKQIKTLNKIRWHAAKLNEEMIANIG